jgi:spore germination protein KC
MNRYKKIASIIAISCLLSGCWDSEEVDNIYLPFGAAVDETQNPKEIKVSFLAPNFSQKVLEDTIVLKAFGQSIGEAQQNMQTKFHHEFNPGHMQIILISEKVATEKDIVQFLDFFGRSPKVKEYMNILVTKEDADMAFDMELQSTPYPTQLINEGVQQNYEDKRYPSRTLRTFSNRCSQEGIEPSLPYLEMELCEGKPIGIIMDKIAVFRDDRMVGVLDEREALGYMLLAGSGDGKRYLMTQNEKDKGYASMHIFKVKSKISVHIKEGEPYFTVKVQITGDVSEYETGSTETLFEDRNIPKLETSFAREFERLIKQTVNVLQKKHQSDIVGFGRVLKGRYPEYFQENRWRDQFEDIKIQVEVKVKIRTIGVSM